MDIEIRPGTLAPGEWPVVHAYIDHAGRHVVIVDALHVKQEQTISRQLAVYTFPTTERDALADVEALLGFLEVYPHDEAVRDAGRRWRAIAQAGLES